MNKYDVIIIGCGASGLSAARAALANNRSVLLLDMGDKSARKVWVSGGGRCNFTNTAATYDKYFGKNPEFVRSVLALVKPSDILDWVKKHNLEYVEKAPGQFFCATTSSDIVSALNEDAQGADILLNTTVTNIEKQNNEFEVQTNDRNFNCKSIIIATGGVSYPALGVSDFGYIIAKKFGHKIIPIEPGLVGLKTQIFSSYLSGISMDVEIKTDKKTISDSLLFTHYGIGGPAAYRASLFDLNKDFHINFLPNLNVYDFLTKAKKTDGKKSLPTLLSIYLPARFAKLVCSDTNTNIADYKDSEISIVAKMVNDFIISGGTLKRLGLENAEVVKGGVSTEFISSKTMESKLCPGLFFAGEVMDITGDLGGFNLHFAFASGLTAGSYV
ncbi:MAG: aminoacetone oxidase family FAD-binding enzyme [Alphaproteobacteria bacterium]|nr:aminoacetone oxidase family FAD-binding enzyme [Alphaproteobacteria bacterium]MBN2674851.1 aminoacetone oxidase family FAD-binding enzyme [Alphaproteobacteria bacterium]